MLRMTPAGATPRFESAAGRGPHGCGRPNEPSRGMPRSRETSRSVREGEGLPHGEETAVSGFESRPVHRVATDRQVTTMPTEWTHHSDGVNTAVSTTHDLDGTLKSVTLQLDTFRVREWEVRGGEDDETDINGEEIPNAAYWDAEDRVYREHTDGAHATLKFVVTDGRARLKSIEPEDGDTVEPRHMPLMRAAERVLAVIDGVSPGSVHTIGKFEEAYDHAEGIHIDALDA